MDKQQLLATFDEVKQAAKQQNKRLNTIIYKLQQQALKLQEVNKQWNNYMYHLRTEQLTK